MTGLTISHHRVLDKPGDAGPGVVYKAEDLNLHCPIAVKFLRAGTTNDPHSTAASGKKPKPARRRPPPESPPA